jgi:hypothetical protein
VVKREKVITNNNFSQLNGIFLAQLCPKSELKMMSQINVPCLRCGPVTCSDPISVVLKAKSTPVVDLVS